MTENEKIENAKDVLLRYLVPDALKPEYDGMSAWELTKKMLQAAKEI